MKIFRPGMPVTYVDEAPPAKEESEASSLPSVEEAMAAAQARHSEILNYTQSPPLKQPEDDLTTSSGQREPHSVNDKPEVE